MYSFDTYSSSTDRLQRWFLVSYRTPMREGNLVVGFLVFDKAVTPFDSDKTLLAKEVVKIKEIIAEKLKGSLPAYPVVASNVLILSTSYLGVAREGDMLQGM